MGGQQRTGLKGDLAFLSLASRTVWGRGVCVELVKLVGVTDNRQGELESHRGHLGLHELLKLSRSVCIVLYTGIVEEIQFINQIRFAQPNHLLA